MERSKNQAKKNVLKKFLLDNPSLFKEVLNQYKELTLPEYDFVKDPLGESLWYPLSREVIQEYPLYLRSRNIDTQDQLLTIVRDMFTF